MLRQLRWHAGLQYTTSNRQVPTRQRHLDLDTSSMTPSQDTQNSDAPHAIEHSTWHIHQAKQWPCPYNSIPGTYIRQNNDAVHITAYLAHTSGRTGIDVRAKAQSRQSRRTQWLRLPVHEMCKAFCETYCTGPVGRVLPASCAWPCLPCRTARC